MLAQSIENKVTEILEAATITAVDTYKVVGIHDQLLDWDEFTEYPRIVLACEEVTPMSATIGGGATKQYVVNIFVLSYDSNKDTCITIRDTVLERVETALRSNQRLSNLADNSNTERVYGTEVGRVKLSKSGIQDNYHSVAWLRFNVFTDRNIPS